MIGKKSSLKEAAGTEQSEILKNSRVPDISGRVLVMENALVRLKESIKSTGEIRDLKNSVSMLSEIRSRLREMEDLELITKLETIQAQDEILGLTDDVDTLQGKMELLSNAIKMISTKITVPDAKVDVSNFGKILSSLKSELNSLKKMQENQGQKNDASKIVALEQKYTSIDMEFKKFVSLIKVGLEKRDKKLESILSTRTGPLEATGKVDINDVRTEIATMKGVVDKIEKRFGNIDDKLKDMQSASDGFSKVIDSETAVSKDAQYLKYVPVLKESISNLYKTYGGANKRIANIENDIDIIRNSVNVGGAHLPANFEKTIKKTIDAELSDVVENISTLSADIKSRMKSDTLKQSVLMGALKKDYETKIRLLNKDICDTLKKKSSTGQPVYEEFAEFRAKSQSDIEQLKKGMKKLEQSVSPLEVENILDNKLIPHAANQHEIAKSVVMLNRKVEAKHIEISKNAHRKIEGSVKPLAERLSQIESDLVLLKDTKTELIDDVMTIIENFERKEEKSGANLNDIEGRYDGKLKELTEKIEMIKSGDGMNRETLENRVRAVQNENEVLRHELEKIKGLYFEILEREKDAPVIIE